MGVAQNNEGDRAGLCRYVQLNKYTHTYTNILVECVMVMVVGFNVIGCTINNTLTRWTRKTMRVHLLRRELDPATLYRSFIYNS